MSLQYDHSHIARHGYRFWPSEAKVRMSWASHLYSVDNVFPNQAWDFASLTVNLSEAPDALGYLIFRSQQPTNYRELYLFIHGSIFGTWSKLAPMPRICIQANNSGVKQDFSVREIKNNECHTLRVDDQNRLVVFAKHVIVSGKIMWNLVITDP